MTSLVGSVPVIAPYVANPAIDPCTAASVGNPTGGTISLGSLTNLLGGNLSLGSASATTSGVATATNMSATAGASVSNVSIPTPAGTISIPGTAAASVTYSCTDGTVQPTVSSNLNSINIGNQTFTLPSNGASETLPLTLPIVGTQIGTVTLNDNTVSATGDTLDLANVQLPGLANIVVGQTMVTKPAGNVCAALSGINGLNGGNGTNGGNGSNGTNGGSGGNGSNGGNGGSGTNGTNGTNGSNGSSSSAACPAGTVLLTNGNVCVLTAGADGRSIPVVNAYSHDITGASVISLALARKRYHSACLRGSGPKFVVVGTNAANRITVAHKRMRVLALGGNDRVTVKGGNGTCVDGGAGKDRILNALRNRVTVYGGTGNDSIRIGNGPAALFGNAGNDKIVAGTGAVRISGGAGSNQIIAHGQHDQVSAGRGRSVAYLPRAAAPYARAHGVWRIHVVS